MSTSGVSSPSLAQPTEAARFCRLWLTCVAGLATLTAMFNVAVDPFLVFGSPRQTGFNALKPASVEHAELAKDHLLERGRWAGLALGTSKVDVGIDPESAAWPEAMRPVFDDGIPGLGLSGVLARLDKGLRSGRVRRVLVMLELPEFMEVASAPSLAPAPEPSPLAHWRDQAGAFASAALSLDALRASVWTVLAQGGENVPDLHADGATTDAGFRAIVASGGAASLFLQKNSEAVPRIARLAAAVRASPRAPTAQLDTLAGIIARCRNGGVTLDLALAPYHAEYLNMLFRSGLWPRYQQAKADITRLVAAERSPAVRLWDFIGFDVHSTEPVPGPSDARRQTRWFWEPSHFTRTLGEKILATIYTEGSGYGVQLTPDSLPARLQQEERARELYGRS